MLRIGFIGDSITATPVDGRTPADVAAHELTRRGYRVQIVNPAVRGTRSVDWLPQTSLFRQAVAAFHREGVALVQVMLGTNDSLMRWRTSPDAYLAAMRDICTALHTEGFTVMLAYSPAVRPRPNADDSAIDTEADTYLLAYQRSLQALVRDGLAHMGDTRAFPYFRDHPDLLWDGIHPDARGVGALGKLWADALRRAG
jgi:lysophospholipase L1-like esterase